MEPKYKTNEEYKSLPLTDLLDDEFNAWKYNHTEWPRLRKLLNSIYPGASYTDSGCGFYKQDCSIF